MKALDPVLLLLGATLATSAPAQSAPRLHRGATVAAARVPIHTQASDGGVDYGCWAAGADYKVAFDGGATFVPYLGRDYPATRSLRWRTLSVAIGEDRLPLTAATISTSAGYRAAFDLGGVVEAYEVRDDGLEQTFEFAIRPGGDGDLVIRGRVETTLSAAPRAAAHAAIDFVDHDGRPIVRYGAATAVDADGRRSVMTTALQSDPGGCVLELRLPREQLAAARFPLVVDPLVGNLYTVTTASRIGEVDVCYTPAGAVGNIWHAYEKWVSSTDADLVLARTDDDGSTVRPIYSDVTSSWSTTNPSLGEHRRSGSVLLAFARYFTTSDTRKLRFHRHLVSDVNTSTIYGTIDTGTAQAWRPDVGTDLDPSAQGDLLVVFQREGGLTWYETTTSQIWGVAVTVAGTGQAGTPFPIASHPFEDFARPTVGKARLWTGRYGVAWQVIGNFPALSPHDDWDIELAPVDVLGNVGASTVVPVAQGSLHEMAPHVAGFDERLLVVFSQGSVADLGSKPSGTAAKYFGRRICTWNGTSYDATGLERSIFLPSGEPLEQLGVDIDHATRSHFLLAYRSTVSETVRIRLADSTGYGLLFETGYVPTANQDLGAGAVAFDSNADRFLLAYAVDTNLLDRLKVDVYEHPVQPTPSLSGPGCSQNAQLSWYGSQLIGDVNCGIRLGNLAPGALATAIVGFQPFSGSLTGVPLVHPGCWLLVPNTGPGYLATLPIGFGPTVRWSLPLPGPLDPMTLRVQGVHFDAGNNEVFTTQRLTVQVVK
ncbi:MAG: hypothetical protein KDE27_26270 [Planctomycetes bacterium]|nr:hypothetical protein [Planctomycetota bacterium]